MFRIALVACLALTLAGCADPAELTPKETKTGECERPTGISNPESGSTDWSLETLTIALPGGAYDLAIPVPVSSTGTNIQDWLDAGNGERHQTQKGTMIRIAGQGPETLVWCVVQPAEGGNNCCAEQYLGAKFTTVRGDPPVADVVFFRPGGVEVAWHAISDYCGGDASFQVAGSGTETVPAQTGAWCS